MQLLSVHLLEFPRLTEMGKKLLLYSKKQENFRKYQNTYRFPCGNLLFEFVPLFCLYVDISFTQLLAGNILLAANFPDISSSNKTLEL